jgi:hypothetical protein
MIKLDINKYLTSKTFNIDNVNYYDTKENRYIKVLSMNKAQLKRICNSYGFTSFLSTSNSQLKLSKNLKELNIHTIGMSFLPHSLFNKEFDNNKLSKDIINYLCKSLNIPFNVIMNKKIIIDLCINASQDCRINCISVTGKGMFNSVYNARLKRKELLYNNPILLIAMYIRYALLELEYCLKHKRLLSNRFNILSDINIENINIIYKDNEIKLAKLLYNICQLSITKDMKLEFDLKPYDYTKDYNRIELDYYKLVYSVNSYDNDKTLKAINNGMSLAMVFNITNQNIPLPKKYKVNGITFDVIDTDKIDYLPLITKQVIHGLRFKTNKLDNKDKRIAKMNKAILSGFVRIAS